MMLLPCFSFYLVLIFFRYVVALRAIPGYYDLVKYLIPLVAVVAFCFVVLCISLVSVNSSVVLADDYCW